MKSKILSMVVSLLIVGCSAKHPVHNVETKHKLDELIKEDVTYGVDVYDPLESMNRGIFYFNAKFDEWVFIPLVDGYKAVTPDVVEAGVSNFMDNIGEISNIVNNLLQLKAKETLVSTGRLVLNSTFGLFGLVDLATSVGMPEYDEDFGQTLAHYGVGEGPYLVLPVFGPSNLRDSTSLVVDSIPFYEWDPYNFDQHSSAETYYKVVKSIDARKRVSYRYHQMGSPFEYELVRYLYAKDRELKIKH